MALPRSGVHRTGPISLLVAIAVALFVAPAVASAADSVYWTDAGTGSNGAIRVGNLDGSGSAQNLGANYASESYPTGVAIDLATGKIYWSDVGDCSDCGAIRVGNLDGSGSAQNLGTDYASEDDPTGVAIDPATGKIYWADTDGGEIRVGNLDGSGSPQTLYTGGSPAGVVIDPAAGKIYWTDDANPGGIMVGNLAGGGTPQPLGVNYENEDTPDGLAIDPAAGKIYWTDFLPGTIRVGNLNGSGTPQDLGTNYQDEYNPTGLAIDPESGKIYWATGLRAIRVGNLDGSGNPANLWVESAPGDDPGAMALLSSPVTSGAPAIAGGSTAGSVLSCSQGQWAADLLGGSLYQAPQSFSFQWSVGGAPINGATASAYETSTPGSYSCAVTAVNAAGSATETSVPYNVTSAPPPVRLKARIVTAKISAKHRRARFTFAASGKPSGFQCALVQKLTGKHKHKQHPKYQACRSPKSYQHLKRGHYTFYVRALNAGITGVVVSKSFTI